ncbi:TetR/AcrR family transcriptional regulator [Gordonia sp. TBRC 11910]|uniref:TetR/AcrR family transcriptional regulator n=1 Tax=Gordonia asplenii TaxID=2725283 RepID=A0A848L2U4_9ACTN|nr:TetR/AcrR family transcriptional regulator [Gordonia asplenii]NMO04752.1 TetR/AcrR family transcriptional regulator [Gordonia asplenii]
MGRKPRFSTDELLDAAMDLISAGGAASATMTAVAGAVGAPSGSMYHRFASRDEMLARLWLRTIGEFQTGFVDALSDVDTIAAIDSTIAFVFDWTAANPTKSALLLQFDEKAIVDAWPESLAADLSTANNTVRQALREFTQRHLGSSSKPDVDRVIYALVDLPYAAVRRHLPSGRPRPWLREFTFDAAHQVLRPERQDA